MKLRSTCIVFLALCGPAWAADSAYEDEIEVQLFIKLNRERAIRDLPLLKWDRHLNQAAREHSRRMAAAGQLSHQFSGETALMTRVAATELRFSAVAENVGLATDLDDLHPGWMQSPGHRENILGPKYNAVGIGVVKAGNRYYATQDFARATEELSSVEAEQQFIQAIQAFRRQHHFAVLAGLAPHPTLRSAVCKLAERDEIRPENIPVMSGNRTTVFTIQDPHKVPEHLEAALLTPALSRAGIGACFRATETYPGGAFWFVFQY